MIGLGIKFFSFLLLSLYFYFTKVNIFKLLKITIIFKSLFFLLVLLDFSNYLIFIYFFIYCSLIFGIYISITAAQKSNKNIKNLICNIILKFIYIYLFWVLLSEVFLFLNLPEYFNVAVGVLIPAIFNLSFFEDNFINPVAEGLRSKGFSTEPAKPTGFSEPAKPTGATEPTDPTEPTKSTEPVEKNLISSENFNLAIDKLFYAIGKEFSRYNNIKETEYAIKWEDLFYWLKTSSILSEKEEYADIEKLSIFLKTKDYNEFYRNIPRFFKYNENFLDYFILNGNVYISEEMFDFFHDSDKVKSDLILDKSKFIFVSNIKANISNYTGNTSLTMFLEEKKIPTINESAEQMINIPQAPLACVASEAIENVLDTNTKKYIFFISISDLFDSNNKIKMEINVKNNNLILNSDLDFKKCNNFWQLDYFKKWYYYWFIELDIKSFLSLNILRKLGINLMDITPDKLMYSMHLTVVEFLEELDILIKAKIWYEHYTGIKYSSLPESTLNEYKHLFIKFWVRQIIAYCKPQNLSDNYYFVTNMYEHNVVYLELLENILFVQSKILEAQWTINTIYVYLPSYLESKEIDPETKLINFYNNIFTFLKKEIMENYKDVYDLRRSYKINIFHLDYPLSCEDLDYFFKYINRVLGTDTPLNIELVSKLKKEK